MAVETLVSGEDYGARVPEQEGSQSLATETLGKITVLDALAEETEGISINASHRSTQMGNGVDAEDD